MSRFRRKVESAEFANDKNRRPATTMTCVAIFARSRYFQRDREQRIGRGGAFTRMKTNRILGSRRRVRGDRHSIGEFSPTRRRATGGYMWCTREPRALPQGAQVSHVRLSRDAFSRVALVRLRKGATPVIGSNWFINCCDQLVDGKAVYQIEVSKQSSLYERGGLRTKVE